MVSVAQIFEENIMSSQRPESIKLVNQWLTHLGDNYSVNLALDERGLCSLRLENKYDAVLRVNPMGESIKVVAYICEEEPITSSKILEEVLMCNFESNFLNGCTIGICRKTSNYTLATNIEISTLNETLLDNLLQNFGSTIDRIHNLILEMYRKNPGKSQIENQPINPNSLFDPSMTHFIKP